MPTITRQQLLDLLDARLDRAELRELAYDVGLDLDNLEGDTKREDLLSLLRFHDQRQTLNAMVANLAQRRPDLDLADTTVEPTIAPVAAPPPVAPTIPPTTVAVVNPAPQSVPAPSMPSLTVPLSGAPSTATPSSAGRASWKSNPPLRQLGYVAVVILGVAALLFLASSVSDPTFDTSTRIIGLVMTAIPAWLAFKLWQALRSE